MKNIEVRARSYNEGRVTVTVINQDNWHDFYTVLISDNREVAAWIPHLGYLVRHDGLLSDRQRQHIKEFINMPGKIVREVDYPTLQDLVRFAHNGMPGEKILKLFYGKDWKKTEYGKRKGVKKDIPSVTKTPIDLDALNQE